MEVIPLTYGFQWWQFATTDIEPLCISQVITNINTLINTYLITLIKANYILLPIIIFTLLTPDLLSQECTLTVEEARYKEGCVNWNQV